MLFGNSKSSCILILEYVRKGVLIWMLIPIVLRQILIVNLNLSKLCLLLTAIAYVLKVPETIRTSAIISAVSIVMLMNHYVVCQIKGKCLIFLGLLKFFSVMATYRILVVFKVFKPCALLSVEAVVRHMSNTILQPSLFLSFAAQT